MTTTIENLTLAHKMADVVPEGDDFSLSVTDEFVILNLHKSADPIATFERVMDATGRTFDAPKREPFSTALRSPGTFGSVPAVVVNIANGLLPAIPEPVTPPLAVRLAPAEAVAA